MDNNNEEEVGRVSISFPKTLPISIIFAVLVQIFVTVWVVASYFKENELLTSQIANEIAPLKDEISALKDKTIVKDDLKVIETRLDRIEDRLLFLERKK